MFIKVSLFVSFTCFTTVVFLKKKNTDKRAKAININKQKKNGKNKIKYANNMQIKI